MGVIAVLFAAAMGALMYLRAHDPPIRLPAAVRPSPPRAEAPLAGRSEGFLGVVLSGESVDVAPKAPGALMAIRVELGQKVEMNQLLAELDPADLRRALEVGRARLLGLEGEYASVSIKQNSAEQRLAREQRLAEHISAEQLEAAKSELQSARAQLQVADARVKEQRAHLEELRASIDDARLRAPFAGTVSERFLDRGARVGPNTPVVRIVSTEAPQVRFGIPEEAVGQAVVGSAVRVQVNGLQAPLTGVIRHISPELDSASRQLLAEAELDRSPASQQVPSGTAARVTLAPRPEGINLRK